MVSFILRKETEELIIGARHLINLSFQKTEIVFYVQVPLDLCEYCVLEEVA